MKELAIQKLKKELKELKGCEKAKAISQFVANTLIDFCNQENEFAQAIYQSSNTLSECCANVVKGAKKYLSDFEVYQSAVAFYFTTAKVNVVMRIDLCGNNGADVGLEENTKQSEIKLVFELTLDDLLG